MMMIKTGGGGDRSRGFIWEDISNYSVHWEHFANEFELQDAAEDTSDILKDF